MTMSFDEIRTHLKQRSPMLMVDRILEIEPGVKIKALKNITGDEMQLPGHLPGCPVVPCALLVEAIGQCASILFSRSTGADRCERELLILGSITEMRYFAAVLPGHAMILEVSFLKRMPGAALAEGIVTVDGTLVAKGKLTFANKVLQVR